MVQRSIYFLGTRNYCMNNDSKVKKLVSLLILLAFAEGQVFLFSKNTAYNNIIQNLTTCFIHTHSSLTEMFGFL